MEDQLNGGWRGISWTRLNRVLGEYIDLKNIENNSVREPEYIETQRGGEEENTERWGSGVERTRENEGTRDPWMFQFVFHQL